MAEITKVKPGTLTDFGDGFRHIRGSFKLGGVVDLGSAVVGNLDDVDLGVHDLRAKENQINVEVLGSSEKAPQGGTDFGLDLIWLQPAP